MTNSLDTRRNCELSPEQQQLVLSSLRAVLDSPYFSKSKRYPALLEFVVRAALDEHSTPLKERTVGVEIFGRPMDYDTGSDSTVRMAMGEVRKRMAAYFSEHPEAQTLIDIPVGGYRAEFHFRSEQLNEGIASESRIRKSIDAGSQNPTADKSKVRTGEVDAPSSVPEQDKTPRRWTPLRRLALTALLVLIVAGTGWWYHLNDRRRREFWWPVLRNNQPALIVVGKMNAPAAASAAGVQPVTPALESGLTSSMAVNDAIVTAQICSTFREYGLDCKITQAASASVADLLGKSVVAVGAFNNPWTLRVLAPLPYQFQAKTMAQPVEQTVRSIIEHRPNGDITLGSVVNSDDPSAEFSKDYAIIARFHSDITDGMAVVVAGLGIPGTTSAGQIVASPEKLQEILSLAPKGWNGNNFEAVIQVDVVMGGTGHVQVIASRFW